MRRTLTEEEKTAAINDPLSGVERAAEAGDLTPDVLQENFGAGGIDDMLQNAEADLAAALNDPNMTPEELENLRFIVTTLQQTKEQYY